MKREKKVLTDAKFTPCGLVNLQTLLAAYKLQQLTRLYRFHSNF